MRTLLFFFFLATLHLVADPKNLFTGGEQAALIDGCGDFYSNNIDEIEGYVPVRHYRNNRKEEFGDGSDDEYLCARYKGGDEDHEITIQQPDGAKFTFKCSADNVYHHFNSKKHTPKFYFSSADETSWRRNTSQSSISNRSNLMYAYIRLEDSGKHFTVYFPDHTIRRYKVNKSKKNFNAVFKYEESKRVKYLLRLETFPSGDRVIYKYDRKDRLKWSRTIYSNDESFVLGE